MKSQLFISLFLALLSFPTFAEVKEIPSLPEKEAVIDVSRVVTSVVLGQNESKDIRVRAVTVDSGLSTDMGPRYRLYITYFHAGELNNTRTAFDLGTVSEVKSTERLDAGIYQIEVVKFLEERWVNVKLVIDTVQVFIDDRAQKLEHFEAPYFSSTVKVVEEVLER